jgi:hypothetical protein
MPPALLLLLLLLASPPRALALAPPPPPPPPFSSLSDFTAGLARLPCRETGDYATDASLSPASPFPPDGAAFVAVLERYLASAAALAASPGAWPLDDAAHVARLVAAALEPAPPRAAGGGALPMLPHVARVDLPLGTQLRVFGDLHGSFHSLLRSLQHLARAGALSAATLRLAPGHALAFLGDYVDRGTRGVETMALLLALKAANPAAVHLARGNHEDVSMNEGSFAAELQAKFPDAGAPGGVAPSVLAAVLRVYESLPRALYLGTVDALPGWCHDAAGSEAPCAPGAEGLKAPWRGLQPPPRHLQGVHGGLEVGFDPRPLLRYYRTAPAGEAAAAAAAPQVYLALIHGYEREAWLAGLPPALRAAPVMPAAMQEEVRGGLFRDWGVRLRGSASGGSEASDGAAGAPDALLAAARSERAAASAQWQAPGGAVWPLAPLDAHPADGFMWADFITSGVRGLARAGLVHARGRGLAWGLALTDHLLASRGLVGVLRAHQHNNAAATGPMLARVVGGGGAYNNWGGEAGGGDGAGHVTTFLSGAFIPGLGFERDAHGLLALRSGDPREWSLQVCGQEAPRGQCAAAGSASSASRFACSPVQWRAVRGEEYSDADTGSGSGSGSGSEEEEAGPAEEGGEGFDASERLPRGAEL